MASNEDGSGNNDDEADPWTYPGGTVEHVFDHDAQDDQGAEDVEEQENHDEADEHQEEEQQEETDTGQSSSWERVGQADASGNDDWWRDPQPDDIKTHNTSHQVSQMRALLGQDIEQQVGHMPSQVSASLGTSAGTMRMTKA